MNHGVSATITSGFTQPVFDSQQVFRAAMDGFANPGKIQSAGLTLSVPPLPSAAAELVLALCDFETPLFLAPSIRRDTRAVDYLQFHSGAPLVAEAAMAAFALIDLSSDVLNLAAFAQGTPEYPDGSTTIIAITTSLTTGLPLTLAGPGIATTAEMRLAALPGDFAAQWHVNRAAFPLGVDILFATADSIMGLPRSTRIIGGLG
jgi:alpha-D-ribose 1-methylphosphonate 5-triphosphate synthase subunit PhnH